MQLINTPQVNVTRYSVTLNGKSFDLFQRWHDRSASWRLDISETNTGVIIRSGAKLLPNVPLVMARKHLMSDGNLYVISNIPDKEALVTRDNLAIDGDYTLVFILDSELT